VAARSRKAQPGSTSSGSARTSERFPLRGPQLRATVGFHWVCESFVWSSAAIVNVLGRERLAARTRRPLRRTLRSGRPTTVRTQRSLQAGENHGREVRACLGLLAFGFDRARTGSCPTGRFWRAGPGITMNDTTVSTIAVRLPSDCLPVSSERVNSTPTSVARARSVSPDDLQRAVRPTPRALAIAARPRCRRLLIWR
jgi:hypothetical protein